MSSDKEASKKFEIINNTWLKVQKNSFEPNSYEAMRIDSIKVISVKDEIDNHRIILSMYGEFKRNLLHWDLEFLYGDLEKEQFQKDLKTLEDLLFKGK